MNTRGRIEAEITRLEICRSCYEAYEAAFDAFNEGIGALETILADLPATTPPTLAEFRESGEWFLARVGSHGEMRILQYGEAQTDEGECYLAPLDMDGNFWPDTDWREMEIKRICDPTWTRLEEIE